jgi:hypothetical protein
MTEIIKFTAAEIDSSYGDVKDRELQLGLRKSLQRYNKYVDYYNGLTEPNERRLVERYLILYLILLDPNKDMSLEESREFRELGREIRGGIEKILQ